MPRSIYQTYVFSLIVQKKSVFLLTLCVLKFGHFDGTDVTGFIAQQMGELLTPSLSPTEQVLELCNWSNFFSSSLLPSGKLQVVPESVSIVIYFSRPLKYFTAITFLILLLTIISDFWTSPSLFFLLKELYNTWLFSVLSKVLSAW